MGDEPVAIVDEPEPAVEPVAIDRHAQTAAAIERTMELGAERALDDPKRLAKAARIVRLALERRRLTIEDLTVPSEGAVAR